MDPPGSPMICLSQVLAERKTYAWQKKIGLGWSSTDASLFIFRIKAGSGSAPHEITGSAAKWKAGFAPLAVCPQKRLIPISGKGWTTEKKVSNVNSWTICRKAGLGLGKSWHPGILYYLVSSPASFRANGVPGASPSGRKTASVNEVRYRTSASTCPEEVEEIGSVRVQNLEFIFLLLTLLACDQRRILRDRRPGTTVCPGCWAIETDDEK